MVHLTVSPAKITNDNKNSDENIFVSIAAEMLMLLVVITKSPSSVLSPSCLLRFSLFSRDKQRSPQRGEHFHSSSWSGKDGVYTEEAQEALQHL